MKHAHKHCATVCSPLSVTKLANSKLKLAEEQHAKGWTVQVLPRPALLGVVLQK